MKKIFRILLIVLLCHMFVPNVDAASASLKMSPSSKLMVVGDKVSITISLSSSAAIGSWNFTVNYDSNYLSYVSSNLEGSIQGVNNATNGSTKSKTYTITFKAKKAGSTTLSFKNVDVISWAETSMSVSKGSSSIKIMSKEQYLASLSSNNNLSSLSVDGYSLEPKFSKDKTSYSLTVPNDVKTINVKATKSDSSASIKGTGKRNLKEGSNKINVVVTAENGNEKTYTINVTVKELNPINVKIGDEDYTVVRQKEDLVPLNAYAETEVTIDGEQAPAYMSDVTGYTIVGLKDKDGNINMYIYDEVNNEYTIYNEYKFNSITIYPLEVSSDDLFKGASKEEIKIGDDVVTAYKAKGMNYPLIYALNVETGEKNWYSYDSSENTIQKYSSEKNIANNKDLTSSDNDKYKKLSIVLGVILAIMFIFMLIATILLMKKSKQKTKVG